MLSRWGIWAQAAWLFWTISCQEPAIIEDSASHSFAGLEERQLITLFSTLGLFCSGCPIPTPVSIPTPSRISIDSSSLKSSSSSSTTTKFVSASKTSSTSSSDTSTMVPATTIATGPYDPHALTTTFTQPAECTNGASIIQQWGDEMWYNAIHTDVANSAYTSCFPPQFYSSVLATTSGLPFTALVCPYSWERYNFNATYIVCCPRNFELAAADARTDTQRPGHGAYCWSELGVGELIDVTSFDATGGSTFIAATAESTTSNVVLADAYDGVAATPLTDWTTWYGETVLTSVSSPSSEATTTSTPAVSAPPPLISSSTSSQSGLSNAVKTSSSSRLTSCFSFISTAFSFLKFHSRQVRQLKI